MDGNAILSPFKWFYSYHNDFTHSPITSLSVNPFTPRSFFRITKTSTIKLLTSQKIDICKWRTRNFNVKKTLDASLKIFCSIKKNNAKKTFNLSDNISSHFCFCLKKHHHESNIFRLKYRHIHRTFLQLFKILFHLPFLCAD